jgi:hypothetical protein
LDAARPSNHDNYHCSPGPVTTTPRKEPDSARFGFGLKHASMLEHETINDLDSMIKAAEFQRQKEAIMDLDE